MAKACIPDIWKKVFLTLSWQSPLSYRNQSIDLRSKSMDWFLYDNGLRHERVNVLKNTPQTIEHISNDEV